MGARVNQQARAPARLARGALSWAVEASGNHRQLRDAYSLSCAWVLGGLSLQNRISTITSGVLV